MSEIGEILKDARENRGLTLNEVYESLRIQPKYLSALESGEYHLFPSSTHVRGYLRKYARHLNLEAAPMLERLELNQIGSWDNDPTIKMQPLNEQMTAPVMPVQPETGTFFAPMNEELRPDEQETDWIGRLIIIALIVAIALVTWRLLPFIFGDRFAFGPSSAELQNTVQEILSRAQGEEGSVAESQPTPPSITSELIVPTSRTNGGTSGAAVSGGIGAEDSGSADGLLAEAEPTRNPLPATLSEINMVVEILQNQTWLRVTVDDIVLYEGLADKGDVQEYSTGGKVNIRTGNGAGVFVRINEIDVGRMGERSEVVDLTWETTQ